MKPRRFRKDWGRRATRSPCIGPYCRRTGRRRPPRPRESRRSSRAAGETLDRSSYGQFSHLVRDVSARIGVELDPLQALYQGEGWTWVDIELNSADPALAAWARGSAGMYDDDEGWALREILEAYAESRP